METIQKAKIGNTPTNGRTTKSNENVYNIVNLLKLKCI